VKKLSTKPLIHNLDHYGDWVPGWAKRVWKTSVLLAARKEGGEDV